MKNKRWLRSVAFMLLLIVSLSYVLNVYSIPKSYVSRNANSFAQERKHSIDGIFVGNSVCASSWSSMTAWEYYGIATYIVSSTVHPFGAVPAFIEYAMEKQDVKYVVIDIHSLRSNAVMESIKPGNISTAYDNIPNFRWKYRILNAIFDYTERVYETFGKPDEENLVDRNQASYYFPFLKFHSRWTVGLDRNDYIDLVNPYKGTEDRKAKAFAVTDCTEFVDTWSYEKGEASDFQKGEMDRVFECIEKNNLQVLFVNFPSLSNAQASQELSAILDYCEQNGYDTLDFCSVEKAEEIGLDFAQDFLDKGHINSKGANKVTKYVAQYLIDNGYYCEDHRGDDAYSDWDDTLKKYKKFYDKGWKNAEKKK